MLTNTEIDKYIQSLKIKDLDYHGAVPLDAKIKKSRKPFEAVIFNTHRKGCRGEHWVCVFIDHKNKQSKYFDSYGREPKTLIKQYLVGFNYPIYVNDRRYQYNNTLCGIYCIEFILSQFYNIPINGKLKLQ